MMENLVVHEVHDDGRAGHGDAGRLSPCLSVDGELGCRV